MTLRRGYAREDKNPGSFFFYVDFIFSSPIFNAINAAI